MWQKRRKRRDGELIAKRFKHTWHNNFRAKKQMGFMVNYDQVEGFVDYTSKDMWRNYIESQVIPLWRDTWTLKEFFENLLSEFQGLSLIDIGEEYMSLLLGGVVPSKEEVYRRNSLAKFYSRFFGLRISDLQSWVLGGGVVGGEIKVIVEETSFTRFVNELFKWLDRAVRYQTLVEYKEPTLPYDELKKDPQRLKVLVSNFYQALLGISVNYNYHTFFLWSIRQIPYKFMEVAYPRIGQTMGFLQQEFGLTELKWNTPFSEDSEFYNEYMIWCFPEYNPRSEGKSFGGAICKANEVIWENIKKGYSPTDLENTLLTLFSRAPDLKKEYVECVKERAAGKYYSCIFFRGLSAAEQRSTVSETNRTIMEMLDEISPQLFVGLAKISYVGDDYFSFSTV